MILSRGGRVFSAFLVTLPICINFPRPKFLDRQPKLSYSPE
jgi:hypothetical protein